MEKAIGYVRASTKEQKITLEMQKDKITQYSKLKDLDLVDIIIDEGKSAKNLERPGMQRLLEKEIKNKEIKHVIIYKLDRAFRSTSDALAVASKLDKIGIALHSLTESLDTKSSLGKFFYTILAACAELERNVISERTSAALQHNKSLLKVYTKNPSYGLKKDNGLLCIDDNEQSVIEEIVSLQRVGISYREIGRKLDKANIKTRTGNSWHPQQIKNILVAVGSK